MNILIINGPNLNLLGRREPDIYGGMAFEDYLPGLRALFPTVGFDYFQSNVEGEIVDALQQADGRYGAVLLNAGGYTHTSVAIADAVAAIGVDVVEVHISSPAAREPFRHTSLIARHCKGSVAGFGLDSYRVAVHGVIEDR